MTKTTSVWELEENALAFLEFERAAVPGVELQFGVIESIARQWCDNPSGILDLGCGNGILGRFLLSRFPTASGVFIDFSDTMLRAASESLGSTPESIVLKADFASPGWIDSIASEITFDIIVSGFAIHHQPDTRKRELYREIYNLLSPGGIFLNLEHVESPTPPVKELFEEFYIDHLHDFHIKSDPATTREAIARELKNRPDKDEDKLAPVDTQCGWLRDIGYNDVDCYFKLFEIALFGGRK